MVGGNIIDNFKNFIPGSFAVQSDILGTIPRYVGVNWRDSDAQGKTTDNRIDIDGRHWNNGLSSHRASIYRRRFLLYDHDEHIFTLPADKNLTISDICAILSPRRI